jgi:class 3 adenylate cyclase
VVELGDYFSLMSGAIEQYKGTLDKYMGDGIMAFFNAPHLTPGLSGRAGITETAGP